MAHVDLAAFSDGIASVSLGAAAVMDFRHTADGRTVAVRLLPGDLLTLHGPARYDWTHGCVRCAPHGMVAAC
jgi:alkylated DNA repair dioxygenase AlkB